MLSNVCLPPLPAILFFLVLSLRCRNFGCPKSPSGTINSDWYNRCFSTISGTTTATNFGSDGHSSSQIIVTTGVVTATVIQVRYQEKDLALFDSTDANVTVSNSSEIQNSLEG